jgi:hypothetical protein
MFFVQKKRALSAKIASVPIRERTQRGHMMKRILTISGATLLLTFTAMAADEVPKYEVSVDYTFAHLNPARNFLKVKNVNGGGGAFTWNLGDFFGIKGDLQGYGSTNYRYTLPSGVTLPNGTVTASPTTGTLQGNLFTYTFGPVSRSTPASSSPSEKCC